MFRRHGVGRRSGGGGGVRFQTGISGCQQNEPPPHKERERKRPRVTKGRDRIVHEHHLPQRRYSGGLKRGQQAYLSGIVRIYDTQPLRDNLYRRYIFNLHHQRRLGYITQREVADRTLLLDRSLAPKRDLRKEAGSGATKLPSAFPILTFQEEAAVQERDGRLSADPDDGKMPGGRRNESSRLNPPAHDLEMRRHQTSSVAYEQ
ncbi:protein FAM216B isoform X2 [Ornithorhynchus anatinus]|uniref:protein FAM216B isoform X2 n=1 Tax=Ornithorhynchus anatinus TaxID=9258 RepID=UPI0010A8550C|nr:protein FAM216B isoform X2 [Ornithorhynchus anatinus]